MTTVGKRKQQQQKGFTLKHIPTSLDPWPHLVQWGSNIGW